MQITISEPEIKEAILDFVSKQGLTIHSDANVDLKAGRGEHGMTATIDIGEPADVAEAPKKDTVSPIKKKDIKAEDKPEADSKEEKEEAKEPAGNKPLFS